VKIGAKVAATGKLVYSPSPIANSGPYPPQVGIKTTLVVVWEARSFITDIADAEVTAVLPTNMMWEDVYIADHSSIEYDKDSKELKWRIGMIPAGTGVLTPSITAAFQISFVPAELDRGREVVVVREAVLHGRDVFTEKDISIPLSLPGVGVK
jgi:hypothetical protein